MTEQSKPAEYTIQDLADDPVISNVVKKYNADRGRGQLESRQAVEEFLEDIRFMEAGNEVAGINFIRYVSNLKQETQEEKDYKESLARLYVLADKQVNTVTGERADFFERVEAVKDYLVGGFTSPLNLAAGVLTAGTLGALGAPAIAGAAAKQAGTRAALKAFVNNAMNKTLSRVALTGVTTGATEAPLSALSEAQLQRAEQELNLRSQYDWSDITKAGAVGFGFGSVTGGLLSIRDPYKKSKKLLEEAAKNLEETPQGRASTQESVAAAMPDFKKAAEESVDRFENTVGSSQIPTDAPVKQAAKKLIEVEQAEGLYVVAKPGSKPIVPAEEVNNLRDAPAIYDPVGLITDVGKDGRAVVSFLSTDQSDLSIPSRLEVTFNLKDLKALSQRETNEAVANYINTYNRFSDKSSVQKGFEEMREQAVRIFGPDVDAADIDSAFRDLRNPEAMNRYYQTINSMILENPKLLNKVDRRTRASDQAAQITRKLGVDEFNVLFKDAAVKNGLSPERFANIALADASLAGSNLARIRMPGSGPRPLTATEKTLVGVNTDQLEDTLTAVDRDLLDRIRRLEKQVKQAAKTSSLLVNWWRSLLVIQPATTLRNIFGSTVLAPEKAFQSFLNNKFRDAEARINGISPDQMPKELSEEEFTSVFKKLISPRDTIVASQILGVEVPQLRKQLTEVFDDGTLGRVPEKGIFNILYRVSNGLNILNRQQDKYFKSAASQISLDSQLVAQRNAGNKKLLDAEREINKRLVADGLSTIKLDNVDNLIRYNKLDLISEEMSAKAIQDAMDFTFQNRRAGDKLVIFGKQYNEFQEFLNNSNIVKAVFPFPNFWMNATVYMINRPLMGGAVKALVRGIQLRSKGGAEDLIQKRQQLTDMADEIKEALSARTKLRKKESLTSAETEELARLNAEISNYERISSSFEEGQMQFRQMKEGITEALSGGAMLLTFYALRKSEFAGERWNMFVNPNNPEGEETDVKASFPVPIYAFLAETLIRLQDGRGTWDNWWRDFADVAGGPSVRAGGVGQVGRAASEYLDSFTAPPGGETDRTVAEELTNIEAPEQAGKLAGNLLGYFLSGVIGTPLRVVEDLVNYFSDPKNITVRDNRIQLNYFGDDFAAKNPGFNEFIETLNDSVLGGTILESRAIDAPERFEGTKEGPMARATDSLQKQLTGFAKYSARSPVQNELDRLGVNTRRINFNTDSAIYNNLANRMLGKLTTDVAEKVIESEEYQSLKNPEDKKEYLDNLYMGRPEDAPTRDVARESRQVSKALRDSGFVVKSSLKDVAREQMKISFPNLNEQRNILKEGKNKVAEAVVKMVATKGNPFSGKNAEEIIKDVFNYKLEFDQNPEESTRYKLLMENIREYLPKDIRPKGRPVAPPVPDVNMQMKQMMEKQQ